MIKAEFGPVEVLVKRGLLSMQKNQEVVLLMDYPCNCSPWIDTYIFE